MQEINLAVVGAAGTGKSTFMQCALDLKKPVVSMASSKKVSLEGVVSLLRLHEYQIEEVTLTTDQHIDWPPTRVGEQAIPPIDGAVILYDVMEQSSIKQIPNVLSESVSLLTFPRNEILLNFCPSGFFANPCKIDHSRILYSACLHYCDWLDALYRLSVPCVLVSSKCDNPPDTWQLDPSMIEQSCKGTESIRISVNAPETYKLCISMVLRNISLGTHGEQVKSFQRVLSLQPEVMEDPCSTRYCTANASKENPPITGGFPRQRALTTSYPSNTTSINPSLPSGARSRHSRATSELIGSLVRDKGLGLLGSPSSSSGSTTSSQSHGTEDIQYSFKSPNATFGGPFTPMTRLSSRSSDDRHALSEASSCIPEDTAQAVSFEPLIPQSPLLTIEQASSVASLFLNSGDEGQEHISMVEKTSKSSSRRSTSADEATKESGVLFDELVDRLLSQPVSKADSKFAAIFLCLYRKFAAPAELVLAIMTRFEKQKDDGNPQIARVTSQLRYLGVILQWISTYPGDFAHPSTRRRVTCFVAQLGIKRGFAVAAREISLHLDMVSEDDDTEWACSDTRSARADTLESPLSLSPLESTAQSRDTIENIVDSRKEEDRRNRSTGTSTAPSISSSLDLSGSQSTGSLHALLNSVDIAQRQAQLLTPLPRNILTKVQWHQFMDTPDENIAQELTRIDWIMFSSIRPRDLIRHVSLSVDGKEKCKSLENVDRMINQFNHVAFWVANLILLREKPKHRAKILERFMGMAWVGQAPENVLTYANEDYQKLRYLNNYNSLGAVMAGINRIAVHRLAQTRELIPHQVQKAFMRLEILMSTQKSHFAYRLAWENTSAERIPYLPLHRRDLIYAEEGNKTNIGDSGDRINWKKFEIMGEIMVGIQRSQATPYLNLNRNEDLQRLVLDGRFSKDDDVSLP